jgi:hypothetical protein
MPVWSLSTVLYVYLLISGQLIKPKKIKSLRKLYNMPTT